MKRQLLLALVVFLGLIGAAPVWGSTYYIYNQWGGTWHDANKTGVDDSLMCWAASAADILDWGNWDTAAYNTETKIFQDIKYYWTNNRGWQSWAWNWWLTGAQAPNKTYAYANVAGGGKYFPGYSFYSYYTTASGSTEMSRMDSLMNSGYGISLVIGPNHTNQHAITCWGYDYVMSGHYQAIYRLVYHRLRRSCHRPKEDEPCVQRYQRLVFHFRIYQLGYHGSLWL